MHEHSSYSVEGQQPDYLDTVLEIFNWHKHPFIMVEECALTWMGAAVVMGQDCDVLVRTAQLPDILRDLLGTGRWIQVEHSNKTQEVMIYADVPRIRRVPEVLGPDNDLCLSLWSEKKYHLAVDGPTVEVLDCCALNSVLIEQRFAPSVMWAPRSLAAEGVKFVHDVRARNDRCTIPIFVPSIPRFLDADLDRYRDNVDKKLLDMPFVLTKPLHTLNLVRYLYLDMPRQKDLVLSEMAPRNWPMMEHLIDTFKRKSSSILSFTPEQEQEIKEIRAKNPLPQ